MATALIRGLLNKNWPKERIIASDPDPRCVNRMAQLGIRTVSENAKALCDADAVVLAVKPQVLDVVCKDLAITHRPDECLFVSIAAGVETASLQRWLGETASIVRCMPNTPALIGRGASVLFAADGISGEQRHLAETLLAAVGMTAWVDDESLMHAVTAVSGSGPAYFFLLIEAIQSVGRDLGLPAALSESLAVQTAAGAAEMALTNPSGIADLRRQVTSPGGTTERAVQHFEAQGFRELVSVALSACAQRSAELAEEFKSR